MDDFITRTPAGPKPADLVQALALPLPSLVISELLGVPYENHAFFQTNSKVLVSAVATPEKLAEPGDDLLSGLGRQIAAGELTRREAAAMGVLLLGGHETTANMITMGTLLLLQHPEQLVRVREADDPKVIASAVEELLRYLSVVHLGRRRTAPPATTRRAAWAPITASAGHWPDAVIYGVYELPVTW
ncbi:hypothetical protein [Streptomyces sp. 6N106]|uniref:hypothetical protein n=1 Tax=Streptomyces sp. 6N106 TaxID=3457418 RepID=UPI003FCEED15